jgi:hypothetical protein
MCSGEGAPKRSAFWAGPYGVSHLDCARLGSFGAKVTQATAARSRSSLVECIHRSIGSPSAQPLRAQIGALCKQQEIYRDFFSRKLSAQIRRRADHLFPAAILFRSCHCPKRRCSQGCRSASPLRTSTKPGAVIRPGLDTLLKDSCLYRSPVTCPEVASCIRRLHRSQT